MVKKKISDNEIVVLREIKSNPKEEAAEITTNLGLRRNSVDTASEKLEKKGFTENGKITSEGKEILKYRQGTQIVAQEVGVPLYLDRERYDRFTICCPNCGKIAQLGLSFEQGVAIPYYKGVAIDQSYGTVYGLPRTGYGEWRAGSV